MAQQRSLGKCSLRSLGLVCFTGTQSEESLCCFIGQRQEALELCFLQRLTVELPDWNWGFAGPSDSILVFVGLLDSKREFEFVESLLEYYNLWLGRLVVELLDGRLVILAWMLYNWFNIVGHHLFYEGYLGWHCWKSDYLKLGVVQCFSMIRRFLLRF